MSLESDENLHTLLSTLSTIDDWTPIYQRVKHFPAEARQRYYRNESPLQLSLKVRERKRSKLDAKSKGNKSRIEVLQLLIASDPSSVISRDEEGRAPLHTACTAGRSWEILQMLIEAEDKLFRGMKEEEVSGGGSKIKEQELVEQRTSTLRTDHPGGNLPLHLVAACPSFDESSFQGSDFFPYDLMDEDAIQCSISQNIISAFNATTTVREAYPQAVWDRDCDGEIPLHSAASWGNVGSVLSLLKGAALHSHSVDGAREAAQTLDDAGKTPLDRACERVCAMSVHAKPVRTPSRDNFRESITREDPFMSSARNDRVTMNRNIRLSVRSRRRIPGVGSSFRSSFTSTSTADPSDINILRDSFVSSRQPVDPVLGLKPLCEDGQEEFAKVEMLVRAVRGHFSTRPLDFLLLHAIVELECSPELVWHAAAKYPDEVQRIDEQAKSPLLVATEKLSHLLQRRRELRISQRLRDETQQEAHVSSPNRLDDNDEASGSDISETEAARNYFVQSFFLGKDSEIKLDPDHTSPQEQEFSLNPDPPHAAEAEEESNCKIDTHILLYQEIIDMLIKSKVFGTRGMATIPDNRGRLPLHILLEAGPLWIEEDDNQSNEESNVGGNTTRQNCRVISTLIEAHPQSLLTKDSVTGFFPFMSAATNDENEDEIAVLETVFRLLLEAPAVISYFIFPL